MLEFENLADDRVEGIFGYDLAVEIGRPRDDALPGKQLQFRIPFEADRAHETQHRRLADAHCLRELGDRHADDLLRVVEHEIGDPPFGRRKVVAMGGQSPQKLARVVHEHLFSSRRSKIHAKIGNFTP